MNNYIEKYLELEINFTDKEDNYDIVEKIRDEIGLDSTVFSEINQLNKLLGRASGGKYKLGFVSGKEIVEEPKLKINKRVRENLLRKMLELNDQIAKVKTKIESEMRDKHGLSKKD